MTVGQEGVVLVWRSPSPLPMADARPEFRLGGRLLGYPQMRPDGRTLRPVLPAAPRNVSDLSVWLSGRRLDGPTPRSALPGAPYQRPVDGRQLAIDPGEPGPYAVDTATYRLPRRPIPPFPEPVEMVGHVVAPVDADGQLPFVLFLHGRHYTCYIPGKDFIGGDWPCRGKQRPVPSHLGYRYAQRLLATQGYVTVSIAANGINGQDWRAPDGGAAARSLLVRRHLRQWADWASGGAPQDLQAAAAHADLDRVLLVGHSRGGEGVNRAAIDTEANAAWDIDGQVLIGPTAFGRQEAPYVPTVVLLPYCDGDVVDLQGQAYVDIGRDVLRDPALRSSVLVMGANHNYFNSEWTPGVSDAPSFDDWWDKEDPVCGRGQEPRLTAREQRAVGRTYVAGAAQLLIGADDRLLPMYDGGRVRVPSAGNADVRSTALGGRRHIIRPGRQGAAVGTGAANVKLCAGRSMGRSERRCGHEFLFMQAPHWPGSHLGEAVPYNRALQFAWTAPDARGGLLLKAPASLVSASALYARVVVDPTRRPVRLDVRIEDTSGRSTELAAARGGRLVSLPGRPPLGKLWAQTLRVPLRDVAGVDLTRIRRIDFIGRSKAGRVWVLDVSGRRPGLPTVPDLRAASVDIGSATVDEGDRPGVGVVRVPVTVRGELTRPARLAVGVQEVFGESAADDRQVLRLEPGQQQAVVPVSYERDTRDDYNVREFSVTVYPLRGAMTSDYLGTARVRDDDPTPTASWRRVERSVSEGEQATWRIRLEKPVDYWTDFYVSAELPGSDRRELSSNDVPRRWWLRHAGYEPPTPPVALSAGRLGWGVPVPSGSRSILVTVPTVQDSRKEPTEAVALRLSGSMLPRPRTVPVLVRDVG